ncbi:MAG: hypothetical protein LBJ71_03265 [Holosporaceae bacterium]|jgi:hypothetical protein|nr:hypothetical protein [Holosporaceae bacterium]
MNVEKVLKVIVLSILFFQDGRSETVYAPIAMKDVGKVYNDSDLPKVLNFNDICGECAEKIYADIGFSIYADEVRKAMGLFRDKHVVFPYDMKYSRASGGVYSSGMIETVATWADRDSYYATLMAYSGNGSGIKMGYALLNDILYYGSVVTEEIKNDLHYITVSYINPNAAHYQGFEPVRIENGYANISFRVGRQGLLSGTTFIIRNDGWVFSGYPIMRPV